MGIEDKKIEEIMDNIVRKTAYAMFALIFMLLCIVGIVIILMDMPSLFGVTLAILYGLLTVIFVVAFFKKIAIAIAGIFINKEIKKIRMNGNKRLKKRRRQNHEM